MAFRWRAYDGPLLVLYGSSFPSSSKNTLSAMDPLWQNFLDPRIGKTFWIRACAPTATTATVEASMLKVLDTSVHFNDMT